LQLDYKFNKILEAINFLTNSINKNSDILSNDIDEAYLSSLIHEFEIEEQNFINELNILAASEETNNWIYELSADILENDPENTDLLLSCEFLLNFHLSTDTNDLNENSNIQDRAGRIPYHHYHTTVKDSPFDEVLNAFNSGNGEFVYSGMYPNGSGGWCSFSHHIKINELDLDNPRVLIFPHTNNGKFEESAFKISTIGKRIEVSEKIKSFKIALNAEMHTPNECMYEDSNNKICKRMWNFITIFETIYCNSRFFYIDSIGEEATKLHELTKIYLKQNKLEKFFKAQEKLSLLMGRLIIERLERLYVGKVMHDEVQDLINYHNKYCHQGDRCSKDSEWYGKESQAPLSADLCRCHEKNIKLVKDFSEDDLPKGFKLDDGLIKYKTITYTSYYCGRSEEEGCLAEGEHKHNDEWEDVFLGDTTTIGDHVICPYHDGMSFDIPEGYKYDESLDAFVKRGVICKLTDSSSLKQHGFENHGDPTYFPVDVNFYE